jgi:hypothetical protein
MAGMADGAVARILEGLTLPANGGEPTERTATSWRPVDLTAALAGTELPRPELCARSDDVKLLYRGRLHWLHGESESCKTWFAVAATVGVLAGGGRVLWIDYEDDDRTVVARLWAAGATDEAIALRLTYLRPDEPLQDRHGRWTNGGLDFAELVAGNTYDLAVIDGVTEAMVTEGLELGDNADIAVWLRRLPRRIVAETGAATACIDHVTKNREDRGRYAIGGQHKLAGLDGAAYTFELVRPFARPTGTDPATGVVVIKVAKDRGGWVRAQAMDGRVAVMNLASYPDGTITIDLDPPGQRDTVDLAVVGRILTYLAAYDGSSQRRIEENVEGKAAAIRESLRWLTDAARAWVRIEKKGQSHLHWLTVAGRSQVPQP